MQLIVCHFIYKNGINLVDNSETASIVSWMDGWIEYIKCNDVLVSVIIVLSSLDSME